MGTICAASFSEYCTPRRLGDLAHQGQEHRRGLLAAGVLAEEVGGRLDLLGQRRTHRVVAGLRRVVRGGFAAEGEDFDTGHQGVHVPDRLALAARDVGDGTEDDAGGDRHLDQHRQRPEEAADATGNGGAEGMQAVRRLTAGVFLEGGGGRAGDFQQRSLDHRTELLVDLPRQLLQAIFDRRAQQAGELRGESRVFQQVLGGLELLEIGGGKAHGRSG
ncbi:Uncharacterised protein [Pseudomonas aeruginosa]|nr:Uncharacterised protein [Pseudomonas aeruginosa]